MTRIATPVSHLFADSTVAERIIACSDALEIRDHYSPSFEADLPLLYHSEQSIVHRMDFDTLHRVIDPLLSKGKLHVFSLHVPSCYEDPTVHDGIFHPRGRRLERQELLDNAQRNTDTLRKEYAGNLVIAIENNNYFPTGAYEEVADPVFLSKLVENAGAAFLLDLGHARISAHNMVVNADDYLARLPLHRVVQIHLSGYGTNAKVWQDAHEVLSEAQWQEAESCLRQLPYLRFVTLEYYRDPELLVGILLRLRNLLDQLADHSAQSIIAGGHRENNQD